MQESELRFRWVASPLTIRASRPLGPLRKRAVDRNDKYPRTRGNRQKRAIAPWHRSCLGPSVRRFFLVLLPFAVIGMLGCASGSADHGRPGAQWVARHGGVCPPGAQGRPQAALQRLVGTRGERELRIGVLDCDAVAAYAWPDGSIFVSRALVELLDDDELTAAIAHEVGHLTSDGHVRSAVSLSGSSHRVKRWDDVELRADAAGVDLLRRSGLPPQAMNRMLAKVRDSGHLSPARAQALLRRIDKLDQN
jgi:Zn-dependent protease with chaperone function